MRESAAESAQNFLRDVRKGAIGDARHAVLLVNDEADTRKPRRDTARTRRESAERQCAAWTHATHQSPRLKNCTRDAQRCADQRAPAFAANTADVQGFDGQSGVRHETRFESANTSEPKHRNIPRLQFLRDRDARKNVSARTAGHDEDMRGAHARAAASEVASGAAGSCPRVTS